MDLLEWAQHNQQRSAAKSSMAPHDRRAHASELGLRVQAFMSGPLGGDQQIGAKIAEARSPPDLLRDPLQLHPHDPDVRALLRVATMQNIPIATTRSTADFVFSSPLMDVVYERKVYDWAGRLKRERILEQIHLPDSKP